MDLMVIAIIAVIIAVFALLLGILTKKPVKRILIYTFLGLMVGLIFGYFLAPVIISFY
jgi:hypothetical protein